MPRNPDPATSGATPRTEYYRKLCARLDAAEAHRLMDRLQVLALTRPDTVRELEVFLNRDESRAPADEHRRDEHD
jgi:hypothetical protein